MSESKESKSDWPALILLLVAILVAFTYGGIWVGLVVLAIGVVALGWNKRHEGLFPTTRERKKGKFFMNVRQHGSLWT